jgi:hypothetical protein
MLGHMRIRVKPAPQEPIVAFDEILASPIFSPEARARLRSYMSHESRQRSDYHRRRYLECLTEDELHLRIGYMIANVTYVSSRNRYSTNNLYANYWKDRLAHVAEELVIRGSANPVPSDVLRHLPKLGFLTPRAAALQNQPRAMSLYRYDKLKHLRSLRTDGEIYLRCASTNGAPNDFARDDANEMCIRLRLLAQDLELNSDSPELAEKQWLKFIDLKINQKTDFFMFCLSQVYDWRLFGDFNDNVPTDDPDERIGCLVITNPNEFARRFAAEAKRFKNEHDSQFSHALRLNAQKAFYYDACDPQECAPLFEEGDILSFAKQRQFTYQHEFRFVLRPDLPNDFFPHQTPSEIPHFQRAFLKLGNLEDISYIIGPEPHPADMPRYYLATKNAVHLASAIGVTLPNAGPMARFTYSVEFKERGRTDAINLTHPQRFSGGSMGLHDQQIDVPTDNNRQSILRAIYEFYTLFDVREHGNHLFSFEASSPINSWRCKYRAYLPCAEPADEKIEAHSLLFEFEYVFRDSNGQLSKAVEGVEINGDTYLAQYNGVGPLHLHVTYRSLLVAEIEFIRRLIDRGIDEPVSYETRSRETDCRCSEFRVIESAPIAGPRIL